MSKLRCEERNLHIHGPSKFIRIDYRRWSDRWYPPLSQLNIMGMQPSTPASKLFGRKTSQINLVPKIVKSSIVKFQKIGWAMGTEADNAMNTNKNLTITQAVTWAVLWLHTRIPQQKTQLTRLCVKFQQCSVQQHFCSTNNQKSAY